MYDEEDLEMEHPLRIFTVLSPACETIEALLDLLLVLQSPA